MPVRDVVVIDLWTDANRGDEALQVSLVRLLRSRYPGARIAGVFRFGVNELDAARPEISSTAAELDDVVGGVRRTYYAAANTRRFTGPAHALVSTLSFAEALASIACFLVLRRFSRPLIGRERYRSLCAVRDADVVVWKGKNFREYPSPLTTVTRAMTLGGAGFFASLLRPGLHCVNASFWPVRQPAARAVYRLAFRRCRSITVRDEESTANAKSLFGGGIPVHQCADLSFHLLSELARPVERPPESATVALTVTAWGDESLRARYVDALVAAVRRLRALGAERFMVVPQVSRAAEDSSALVGALRRRLSAEDSLDIDVVEGEPSIPELLRVYAGTRMLVGSRMHSCVFARAVGVPFVALSYDTGPKWGVLASFWDERLILDYRTGPDALADACERVWLYGADLVAGSDDAWRACVTGARENVAWLDD